MSFKFTASWYYYTKSFLFVCFFPSLLSNTLCYNSHHQIACFKTIEGLHPPFWVALSHQYSIAGFVTLRVLSYPHSPGLRSFCCNVVWFCCDLEVCNLVTATTQYVWQGLMSMLIMYFFEVTDLIVNTYVQPSTRCILVSVIYQKQALVTNMKNNMELLLFDWLEV
jgi:hypothetical protein